VIVRLLAVAVSIAIIAVLVVRLSDTRSCIDARKDVFASLSGKGEHDVSENVETIKDRCEGSQALVATAGALTTMGKREEALVLAHEAADRDPESFQAWRAIAALESGAAGQDARRRAKELNPRWNG
jgi:hypothetical protein